MSGDLSNLSCFVINLPRSKGRREAMQAQLANINLPYQLFNAVDGRKDWDNLQSSINLVEFQRNVGRDVLPGEIGAYHSHISVWRSFLKTGKDVGLILEDDVVFHDDFVPALQEALRIRKHWDFLKLNKIRAKQPVQQGTAANWVLNAYIGPATGLGAYLITRDLAGKLCQSLLPITRPIDHELDRIFLHDFRHLGLEPFPSHVDDGNESTITGTGFSEVKKYVWYKRLPAYGLRWGNLTRKIIYLLRNRQIRNKKTAL